MKNRYLSILLIICLAISLAVICSCCSSKTGSITVKYESKYANIIKKNKNIPGIINLGETHQNNYNYDLGPKTISNPHFDVMTVDKMP